MKKIALFSLVLAIGFIIVQPLRADTITYTIQEKFSLVTGSTNDPLGIGSGNGTAIFNFTAGPPPYDTSGNLEQNYTEYYPVGLTLTLSGTNADGIYTPLDSLVGLRNFYSTTSSRDSFTFYMESQISSRVYGFRTVLFLPQSFWQDSENPTYPKLLNTSDVLESPGGITNHTDNNLLTYSVSSLEVTSQVVPVPPTVWLLTSSLLVLAGWRRFRKD
jgi:hypothetical protein